jgi:hypothetical protein
VGPATVHHASRYPLRTSFEIAWHICEQRNGIRGPGLRRAMEFVSIATPPANAAFFFNAD